MFGYKYVGVDVEIAVGKDIWIQVCWGGCKDRSWEGCWDTSM